MTKPAAPDEQGTSTRPYLIRALHDWCTDNGFTPYIAVAVAAGVQVPMEYVKNNEIVLNVGFEATSSLQLGNDFIEFKARFGGVAREIRVPVDHVVAIYARENGQGMAFPVPAEGGARNDVPAQGAPLRGLRLASSEGEGEDQPPLSSAPQPTPDSPPSDIPPEPAGPTSGPAATPGGRPALKRIK